MKTIGIIGSGNVAKILGKHLNDRVEVKFVYSRTTENAKTASGFIGCNYVEDLVSIPKVDLIIVAVSDDQISNVIKQLPIDIAVVHTSGSIPIEVFGNRKSCGVLYPLQTFGGRADLKIEGIPFLIEGSNSDFILEIKDFVTLNCSKTVLEINSKKRKEIHLAAVFACNFVTQMFVESENILKASQLDLALLSPLINETIRRNLEIGPSKSLTGPAKRGDKKVLYDHLKMIDSEDAQAIYKLISNRILKLNGGGELE
ncbi:MAG: Rossmann-like and DUF2520 domain-containing protein [Crocinitomicaceae bacterium]